MSNIIEFPRGGASGRAGPHLLEVKDLAVSFHVGKRIVEAVKGVSFTIDKGETVAVVGESGSGKSVTALSVMQLLPYPRAFHPTGSIKLNGEELIGASDKRLQKIRGDKISMIFQEPMTSLNPLHTVEKQIAETLFLHRPGITKAAARERVLELLNLVGIKEAEKRLGSFPHTLSGGQRQRVMIAMALANEPDLLIADEPTTAVDVTIQAQILKLLQEVQQRMGMAILFITHELGIVRKFANRTYVMHQGKFVEEGDTASIFKNPRHAYTQMLLASEPKPRRDQPPTLCRQQAGQLGITGNHGPHDRGMFFPVLSRAFAAVRRKDRCGAFAQRAHQIAQQDELSPQIRRQRQTGFLPHLESGSSNGKVARYAK